jgi:hypothetical protein
MQALRYVIFEKSEEISRVREISTRCGECVEGIV